MQPQSGIGVGRDRGWLVQSAVFPVYAYYAPIGYPLPSLLASVQNLETFRNVFQDIDEVKPIKTRLGYPGTESTRQDSASVFQTPKSAQSDL